MSPRQINVTMRWSAAALGAIAVVSLALALVFPLNSGAASDTKSAARGSSGAPKAPASLPPLESFDGIVSASLRKPLTEDGQAPQAAVVAPAAPVQVVNQSQIKLVGTIGASLAMLRGADGAVVLRGVGSEIDGAEVLAIRPSQVYLRVAGREVTIEKENVETPEQRIIRPSP